MSELTSFRGGITSVGQSLVSDNLEASLLAWFQWSMLGIGGFYNVTIPASGAYGGSQERLRLVSDPNYGSGQVWEGFRRDWVWETGIEYPVQPIRVSGVYVDGNFQPVTGVGPYAHYVDYPRGRVVFQTPISTSSIVTCEYSHRYCQFTSADVPWWREVQQGSFRVDDQQFLQVGSGAWNVLSDYRVQLPAVVVEVVPNSRQRGFALGGGRIVAQDVLFHVITEDPWNKKLLPDIITAQWTKRINAFDKNAMAAATGFPLDSNGFPVPGARMYPNWIGEPTDGGWGWRQVRFMEFSATPQSLPPNSPVDWTTVRGVFELDLP